MDLIGRTQTRNRMIRGAGGTAWLAVVFFVAALWTPAAADQAEDQLNFATGLFIDQDYEMAAEEYAGFLKKHATHALAGKAQFQLGECLVRLKKYKEAVAPLEAYVKRPKTEPDRLAAAYFRLAKAYTELEDFKKAGQHYGAFAGKFPQHQHAAAAAYWVGECFLRTEQYGEARTAFEQALPKTKGGAYEAFTIYGLGAALYQLKEYDSALKYYQDVAERFSKEAFAPNAALKVAQCYDALEQPAKALAAYSALEQKFGSQLVVESLLGRAWAYYHDGKHEKAAELFSAVAEKHPEHAQADVARYNAGSALFNLERYKEAQAFFDKLSAGKSDYALSATYWQGMCLLRLKQAKAALTPLRQAAGQQGKFQSRAKFAFADALLALDQKQDAQLAYEALVREFPKDDLADEALQAAATVASDRGENAAASALAQQLIDKYPQSPLLGKSRFLVGEALFRDGKYTEADKIFKAILKTGVEGVDQDALIYKQAWCAYKTDQQEPAAAQFQRVAEIWPKSELAAESLYMAGKILFDLEKTAEARALYAKCLADYPQSPGAENAQHALALADFRLKKWSAATKGFKAFIEKHPESKLVGESWFWLAESHFADKDWEAARKAYQLVISEHAGTKWAPMAYNGHAWCYREKGDMTNAAQAFAATALKYPEEEMGAEALYWAGRCSLDAGDLLAAGRFLDKALAAPKLPKKIAPDAAYDRARCQLRAKKYDDAIAAYGAFLKQHPTSERVANAYYDLAWAHQEKGNKKGALTNFQETEKRTTDKTLKGDALFRIGEALYEQGEFTKAAEAYEKIVKLGKVAFLDKVYYKLGWSREKLEQYPAAAVAYRKVLDDFASSELAPDSALRCTRMLLELGKHDEVATLLEGLLKKESDLEPALAGQARFYQAEALRSLKKWQQALPAYKKLLEPGSKFEPAYHVHYGLGVCLLELDAYQDAAKEFGKVVEQTETETAARAQLALGDVLYRQKKFDDAARAYLKVKILYGYPKWKAQGLLRAAQAFEKAGSPERAERYKKQLLDEFPDSVAAKEAKMAGAKSSK